MYTAIRAVEPKVGWDLWRETRDELFRSHPQSPLPAERRTSFEGLEYWPYDPQARVLAELEDMDSAVEPVESSGAEPILFRPFARASFELRGEPLTLEVAWLAAYGGGAFLSFRDATSGRETTAVVVAGRTATVTPEPSSPAPSSAKPCSTLRMYRPLFRPVKPGAE